jgi:DNA-binding beta-propeller fold protein YncE
MSAKRHLILQASRVFLGAALILMASLIEPATVKVRTTVDNANIKATPEIGGKNLATVPLHSVLDADAKQGEWYKVYLTKEGVQIAGYIHEMLVEEVGEQETSPAPGQGVFARSPAELVAEIELRLEDNRNLIRQQKDLEKAVEDLRPLIAKTFSVDDRTKQRQIACEIYLWLGLACAKQKDSYGTLKEFKNMFEVDYVYAKEITRNIYDPEVSGLIEHADKQFRGLIVEYSIEISTEPKEAVIKINGKEIGRSPEVHRTIVPKFTLEIEKEGYKPVREEIFLTESAARKDYVLISIGRTVALRSNPQGAKVYLDGADTGKVTDCDLPYVPYGFHRIRLEKENYAEWEESVQIVDGSDPFSLTAVLTVKDYVYAQKWGGPETRFFKLPKAIAIDQEGNFYVVDESDIKAKKFNSQGQFQSSWGDAGREFRVLKDPTGIAVDSQGLVYITDARNACVMKFTKGGKFVSKWGKEGALQGELNSPLSIAADRNDDLYVADSNNHRIVKYSAQGTVKKVWGKQGTQEAQFMFPAAVAVDEKNDVVVVDRAHVQKFTPEGELIAAWAKPGAGDGEINWPRGVSVDLDGYIYIADTGNNRVVKFGPDGRFITRWGTSGTADGQMIGPSGVTVNTKREVFVVERDNNRIQQFRVR